MLACSIIIVIDSEEFCSIFSHCHRVFDS